MGYFREVDGWLDTDEVKRDIRERIVDSYRNGQKAVGQPPAERAPEERRSRRFARRARWCGFGAGGTTSGAT